MRKIKFRVWDKKKKEWLCGYKTLGGFNLFGEFMAMAGLDIKNWNNIEIMQFTGLLDKEGKEIYEGDIIGLPYIDPMGGISYDDLKDDYNYAIGFEFGRFVFLRPNTENQNIVEMCRKEKGDYISNYGNKIIIKNIVECEVIGNIYENSELLK